MKYCHFTKKYMVEKTHPINLLNKTALIIEGGGLRGIFGSGVIRYLMEKNIHFPYVIGVSSGACNGSNYVSQQLERNRIVNIDFIRDPRYINYRRWFLKGELFGMDFLFDTLPNQLAPFDLETFLNSTQKMVVGVTDCYSGEPVYYNQHNNGDDFLTILRASCSLPLMAPAVEIYDKTLMDGGIANAIPLQESISDGNSKHVVILTRPKNYRKKKTGFLPWIRWKYPQLKGLHKAMASRHIQYNKTLDRIDQLEAKGKVFVIRPPANLKISRAERNPDQLTVGYQCGYQETGIIYCQLCKYLNQNES
jgi:predicted patatin/cPLA2 family phospholipase